MFTTSIIPLNMFIVVILGIVEGDTSWIAKSFSFSSGTANLITVSTKEIFKISHSLSPIIQCNDKLSITNNIRLVISCNIIKFFDITLGYVGKILYPRSFSFISIPKIIVMPALIVAFNKFKLWWAEKDKRYLFPLILLFNVLVYIFRASHGRYLLCVSPLFMLFFILFLEEGIFDSKLSKKILITTTLFVLLGLLFESTFLMPKIILETLLLILFWVLMFIDIF